MSDASWHFSIVTRSWPWIVSHSIMLNVTWRRFDQSVKQLVVGQTTINRWRTVASGTWKYDDPRLNMSHEGAFFNCRLTSYELIRWLVETPSRDFEHYRMTDDSPSRSRDNWKMSGGRLTSEKCQETRSHEFDPRPITKSKYFVRCFCLHFVLFFCLTS